ncbi:glycosyltransferase [Asaia astilbis]|uniref:glycosyltransferase n=1 Tax=Asaia astilbis TaxID=610244 RepID=UPI0012EC7CA8|nr:glycosyltransferase [Asaia astilbis]
MSVISLAERQSFRPAPGSIGVVLRDFRLGGSERVAIGLANYWSSRGIEVTLVVGRLEGPLSALVDRSIRIVDLGLKPRLGDKRLAWSLAFGARRVFCNKPVDACYIPGNSHWPVVPLLKTLPPACAPRIVAQVSSPVCRANRSRLAQRVYDWRMRWLLKQADTITTLSDTLARETRDIVGCARVEVVPLPALWDEGRRSPVPDGCKTILAAGRLVRIKGFDLLIKAFRGVASADPDASLTICGDGPERSTLEALVSALDLSGRVTFTGYVPSIRPFLDQARLFVLSSHCESFGAVLLEALAAGRQVVSTRCSPAVESLMTSPLTGLIVPTRDEAALAEALSALLAETPPEGAELARLVAPFHVSHGGEVFLALMQRETGSRAWRQPVLRAAL